MPTRRSNRYRHSPRNSCWRTSEDPVTYCQQLKPHRPYSDRQTSLPSQDSRAGVIRSLTACRVLHSQSRSPPVVLRKDNQLGFPGKIPHRADASGPNGVRFSEHRPGLWVRRGTEGTLPRRPGAQSENWKRLSGAPPSAGWPGCSALVGVLLPCEWEDDECELSLELLRVSVLVLVFFILRLFARGALSTFWRQNPSLLYLLKA